MKLIRTDNWLTYCILVFHAGGKLRTFASGGGGAWGVATDTVTDNIWLINLDAPDNNPNEWLVQIGPVSVAERSEVAIPALAPLDMFLILMLIALVAVRRFRTSRQA